jgi:hypothetical protein
MQKAQLTVGRPVYIIFKRPEEPKYHGGAWQVAGPLRVISCQEDSIGGEQLACLDGHKDLYDIFGAMFGGGSSIKFVPTKDIFPNEESAVASAETKNEKELTSTDDE